MARDTISEKLINSANVFYERNGIALIKKREPMQRMVGGRIIFSSSLGLDFSGTDNEGRFVSIEVKETEQKYMPISGIRDSQIDIMKKELKMSDNVFLVVFFSKINEWYRLDVKYVVMIFEKNLTRIPLEFFIAYGRMIPTEKGFPDFLNAELHPMSNETKRNQQSWMPKPRKKKKITPIDKSGMTREERIADAFARGVKKTMSKKNLTYYKGK